MNHRRRTSLVAILALAAAFSAVGASLHAPPAAAAAQVVRFDAGPQTGYMFSSTGAITATKTVTLAKPGSATYDSRAWITGRGAFFRLTSSVLTGYWVRESMVTYVPGMIVTKSFNPPAQVAFPAGTYLGYTFDGAWDLLSTRRGSLSQSSAALASRRAVIDGRPYAQIVSGTWAGYWMPITSPTVLTASRLTCSVPAKVAAGSAQVFRVLPGASNQIALTFDMGGRMDPAVDIIERLITDRVCATIFPTAAASLTAQGKAAMALVKAHPELFEMGNHTYYHCNFRDGGGGAACPSSPPSAAFIANDLKNAATVIRNLTGMDPAPYWRPPYGAFDSRVQAAAAAAGYTKTFMWDIDTIDWRPVSDGGPTAAFMADKVVTKSVNGSNVLMHLGGWNTLDALPSMIYRLRAKGLTPTTISQILR